MIREVRMMRFAPKAAEPRRGRLTIQEAGAEGQQVHESVLGQFEISDDIVARRWRHPERSRFSGGAKDLPLRQPVQREIPRPAVKNAGSSG